LRPAIERPARRGFALIYAAIIIIVLVGVAAFAVDLGRGHMAKTELQATADAAARAAVWRVPDRKYAASDSTSVRSVAATVAGANKAAGTAVALDKANDVTIGYWSLTQRTFTSAVSNDDLARANAVKVVPARTTAKGTAIAHYFAPAIGTDTSTDVSASAVAMIFGSNAATGHGWGLFGKQFVTVTGTLKTDSYDPSKGPYGGTNVDAGGGVASNGPIAVKGSSGEIHGDVRAGAETSTVKAIADNPTAWPIDLSGHPTITGWQGRLDGMIHFPSVTAPTSWNNAGAGLANTTPPPDFPPANGGGGKSDDKTDNGKTDTGKKSDPAGGGTTASKDVIMSAGTYYVNDFKLNGNENLVLTSTPVVIYVAGDVDISGGVSGANLPADLKIFVLPSSTSKKSEVNLGGGSALYAHVYAPDSDVKIHGTGKGGLYGSVIGDSLTIHGNSEVHYDGNTDFGGAPKQKFTVQLVQ